jgi:RsiW-degrading membrane proteinase PrsW (M82 family)
MRKLVLRPRAWSTTMVAVAVLAAFVVIGLVARSVALRRETPLERAGALASSGDFEGAENAYWQLLETGPVTVPLVVAFLDNHERIASFVKLVASAEPGDLGPTPIPSLVAEDRIDAFFVSRNLPPDVLLLGRFWRDVTTDAATDVDRVAVEAAARSDPPMPWANRLLGRWEEREQNRHAAALDFEREGIDVPGHEVDVTHAIELLMRDGDWQEVDARAHDASYAGHISFGLRYAIARHDHDWIGMTKWFVPYQYEGVTAGVLGLAAAAALAWFWICGRIGQISERPKLRVPLYALAFFLGIVSIYVTLAILEVEDHFGFRENGNPLGDLIYFVLGVGLREEFSKILCFLPLLPLIRRRGGGKREVLACGAFVGLGFAAEENVNYFSNGHLSIAITRFLTANFFHIALTGTLANAVDDFFRDREGQANALSRTAALVVGAHGLYDFCIGNETYGDISWVTVIVFVLMARTFLRIAQSLRGRTSYRVSLQRLFVVLLSALCGATFVYACVLLGPAAAARAVAAGTLGSVFIVVMFVQELEGM